MIVMKPITPKTLDTRIMRLVFDRALRSAGKEIKKDFEKTTRTWSHKPKFTVDVSTKPSGPEVMVGTDDQIYDWVDQGTAGKRDGSGRTYPIFAGFYTGKSDKKVLAFSSESAPKTQPNNLQPGRGFVGPIDTFVPYVEHPGIEPRNFSKKIKEKREKWFKKEMEKAMQEATKKSGFQLK